MDNKFTIKTKKRKVPYCTAYSWVCRLKNTLERKKIPVPERAGAPASRIQRRGWADRGTCCIWLTRPSVSGSGPSWAAGPPAGCPRRPGCRHPPPHTGGTACWGWSRCSAQHNQSSDCSERSCDLTTSVAEAKLFHFGSGSSSSHMVPLKKWGKFVWQHEKCKLYYVR